jgi:hypothetical protein
MATSWLDDSRSASIVEMYRKDNKIRIVEKTGWFWTTISWFLFLGTFGQIKRDTFMEEFATTIGNLVAFPRGWTYRQMVATMPHEAEHVRQGLYLGLWTSPWVGLPLFFLLYVLLPIPLGFAWFRYYFEREASRATTKMRLKAGVKFEECHRKAKWSAERVASSSYGWAVPTKFAVKGYAKMVDQEIKKFQTASAA